MSICLCWGLEEVLRCPPTSGVSSRERGREQASQPGSAPYARLQAGGLCRDGRGHKNTWPSTLLVGPGSGVAGWEQGNGRKRPSSLWGWIKVALGVGLLVWAGRRGKGTQLKRRHFKNLLLFHFNSTPPTPQPVPPRMAFPLWNQGPRICVPLCWKGGR